MKNQNYSGLLRRLAALFYDSLLLIALLLLATALLMPFTQSSIQANNPFFTFYLLLISFTFYAGFWLHGGQTLGMRAWRLQIQSYNGQPITIKQTLLRFSCALLSLCCCGLGFLWIIIDPQKQAWHDSYSKTGLVLLNQ